jgi:hypothetical protein
MRTIYAFFPQTFTSRSITFERSEDVGSLGDIKPISGSLSKIGSMLERIGLLHRPAQADSSIRPESSIRLPVHTFRLIEMCEITPYKWVHLDEDR